jgi:CO/xanthine dehydrogenase FAD-binding subunit
VLGLFFTLGLLLLYDSNIVLLSSAGLLEDLLEAVLHLSGQLLRTRLARREVIATVGGKQLTTGTGFALRKVERRDALHS